MDAPPLPGTGAWSLLRHAVAIPTSEIPPAVADDGIHLREWQAVAGFAQAAASHDPRMLRRYGKRMTRMGLDEVRLGYYFMLPLEAEVVRVVDRRPTQDDLDALADELFAEAQDFSQYSKQTIRGTLAVATGLAQPDPAVLGVDEGSVGVTVVVCSGLTFTLLLCRSGDHGESRRSVLASKCKAEQDWLRETDAVEP
jgi:hypothetical protein